MRYCVNLKFCDGSKSLNLKHCIYIQNDNGFSFIYIHFRIETASHELNRISINVEMRE